MQVCSWRARQGKLLACFSLHYDAFAVLLRAVRLLTIVHRPSTHPDDLCCSNVGYIVVENRSMFVYSASGSTVIVMSSQNCLFVVTTLPHTCTRVVVVFTSTLAIEAWGLRTPPRNRRGPPRPFLGFAVPSSPPGGGGWVVSGFSRSVH